MGQQNPRRRQKRIIVLGSGVSGLACSQELRQRGYEVLVIEARSRVGGRLKGEVIELGNEYPSTIPITSSSTVKETAKAKVTVSSPSKSTVSTKTASPKGDKDAEDNSSGFNMTRQHPVDVGGALIHGINSNPMYGITSQMGVPVHPISSHCLLMDENGWPFDPKVEEKMNNFFNECLDVTFAQAEKDRDSKLSFGNLFERVCREKSSNNNRNINVSSNGKCNSVVNNNNIKNTTPNGNNVTVSSTNNKKNKNTNWENPLLRWHRANLELPSGASFYNLGNTWNEDEPYGFDGVHAAVEPSWKIVMEKLADGLDILYNSPVTDIRVVLPDGTTPIKIPERTMNINNDDDTSNSDLTSNTTNENGNDTTLDNIDDNNNISRTQLKIKKQDTIEDKVQKQQQQLIIQNEVPEKPSEPARRRRPTFIKRKKPTNPIDALPETRRFSRRVLDLDADVRRSSRSTKGVIGKKLEFSHHHSISYDNSAIKQKRKRRRRKMTNGNVKYDVSQLGKSNDNEKEAEEIVIEEYPSSTVQVTIQNGNVFEADALVCTLPLGVLKIPQNESGHIRFVPSLSSTKKNAIQELGCGLLNKCVVSFQSAFWQDSDFLGKAETEYSYLVLNATKYTQKPILIFMYGGDFARDIEDWTDTEIVSDCLDVLKKICGREIPSPIDYCITRWGQEQYSRMAFTCIPPGVDGKKTLSSISQPVHDPALPEKPLLMFAGEHTTPYFPSTMHGAFLSGIREAYRFDLFMEPFLNDYMKFNDSVHVYQHTFATKRVYKKNIMKSPTVKVTQKNGPSNQKNSRGRGFGGMTLRMRPKSNMMSPAKITNINIQKTASSRNISSPDITATRRSQRSLGSVRKAINMLSPTRVKNSNNGDDLDEDVIAEQLKLERKTNIAQQEDRTLIRALESYGQNYKLLKKVLPVYGSTRKRSAKLICDRWQRLVSSAEKQPDLVSSWQAKRVSTENWDTHMARIAADATPSSETKNESSSVRRSHRGAKPRSFVDM